jgi:hypothetical protein
VKESGLTPRSFAEGAAAIGAGVPVGCIAQEVFNGGEGERLELLELEGVDGGVGDFFPEIQTSFLGVE